MILNYVDSKHQYNERLDKEFSVYQEIYSLDDSIIEEYVDKDKFPVMEKFIKAKEDGTTRKPLDVAKDIINIVPSLNEFDNGSYIDLRDIG